MSTSDQTISSPSHSAEECSPYPVLQEFSPQSKLLSMIPAQAQRGIFTIDINLTCVDVADEYIAIGSSVGIVYLYDRKKDKMHKLRNEDYTNPVTHVKLLISLECLVVFGSKKGLVMAFKVPFKDENQIEKFTVDGLHKAPITALEWAKNGMKFFSGDSKGVVVCTDIEHLEHQSRSHIVMDESNEIVQLSYSNMTLLVSTLQRSVLYLFSKNMCLQVGQKDRKCSGSFGATFFIQGNTALYACRPGQRIWKSDVTGVITETIILKSALSHPHPKISLLRSVLKNNDLKDFQFGSIKTYNSKYLITWSKNSVVVIDPEFHTIVASCCDLNSVTDLATSNDEILILQGIRHLIRIAVHPESGKVEKEAEASSVLQDILLPLKDFSSSLKEKDPVQIHSSQEVNDPPDIFGWIKRKLSDNSQSSEPLLERNQDALPDVVKLDLKDCVPIQVIDDAPQPVQGNEIGVEEKDVFSPVKKTDDIVFRQKKKKREKVKKVHFADGKATTSKTSDLVHTDFELKDETLNLQHTKHIDELSIDTNEKETVNSETKDSIQNTSSTIVEEVPKSHSEKNAENITNNSSNLSEENGEMLKKDYVTEIKFKADDDTVLKSILNKYSQLKNDETNENLASASKVDEQMSKLEQSDEQSVSDEAEKLERNSPNLSINIDDAQKSGLITTEDATSPDEIYSKINFGNIVSETNLTDNLLITTDNKGGESDYIISDSPLSASLPSLDIPENDIPKYGVDFVQYNTPGPLISLSISNNHIFCIDNKNTIYYSNFPVLGFKWKELYQPGEQIAVSASEHIVWILYKGTVYAPRQNPKQLWDQVEWVGIAREIAHISVGDTCGWYVSSSGHLISQQHLSASHCYDYPESVSCLWKISQVACRDRVVWILTTENKLYCRTGITTNCLTGSAWKEIQLGPIESINTIALGSDQVAWIVDNVGTIWFRIGVTPQTPKGLDNTWQVETSGYVYQYTDQIKKAVMKVINIDMFSSFIHGPQSICFAASESGVWYCKDLDNVLYSNQKSIIGHSWEIVIPVGTVLASKWNIISAGGVFNSQGEVWCTTSAEELLCMSVLAKNPIAVELPTSSPLTCIESMPQSLWVLSSEGNIYIRRDISEKCPQGVWWQKLNLSQLCDIQLSHISCSSEVVWACDAYGNVYMRLGTLNPPAGGLEQAWIKVDSNLSSTPFLHKSAIGKKFPLPLVHPVSSKAIIKKVYVGPKRHMVWALDDKSNVYVRDGITLELPLGERWAMIPGPHAKQLCISKDTVWILKQSGKIYRRFGITENNLVGDYWKLIPGNISYLSVTFDDDLWGIHDESLWCHNSFALQHRSNLEQRLSSGSISDDDWEDVMSSSQLM